MLETHPFRKNYGKDGAPYAILFWLGEFAGAVDRRVLGDGFVPDVVVEPIQIGLEEGAERFGLIHTVAEPGVEDHARVDTLIL